MSPNAAKAEYRSSYTGGNGRGPWTQSSEDLERRLFVGLLVLSAVVHGVVLVIQDFSWLWEPAPIPVEWAVEAELVTDVGLSDLPPTKTVIPEAKKAPEAKAPENMLPQLPKTVSIKEQPKSEEAIVEEAPKEEPKKEEIKTQEQPQDKPKKEEEVPVKPDQSKDNPIARNELIKRRALEALASQKKTAKVAEAPEVDEDAARLAKLQQRLKDNPGLASPRAGNSANAYLGKVEKAIRRNYLLPEAYNLKGADMHVLVALEISERGGLMDLEVERSSGDPVFDELTIQAVRASVPLPPPPTNLAGRTIRLRFTP